jgi:hypothetical protein
MASQPRADDGVKEAVRRVRLAAGSFAGPLDAFTIAAAVAQGLPDVLNPALEQLAPSPFGGLEGLLGGVTQQGAAAPGRSGPKRPAPAGTKTTSTATVAAAGAAQQAPRPAPVGPAERASAAFEILGRFVTDELTVLGVAPAQGATPAQPGATAPAARRAPAPAGRRQISTDELLLDEIELMIARGSVSIPAQVRAPAVADFVARGVGVPQPLLPAVRGAAEAVGAGIDALEELTGTAPAKPAAATAAAGGRTPAPPTGPFGGLLAQMEQIVAGAASQPGKRAPAQTPAKPKTATGDVDTTPLEAERRKLLGVITAAEQAAAAAAAAPAAPSASDRDDVAWLVNEALVEQARLHGMDLR